MMNRAVFIDKDGTLVHDVPYNVDPTLVRLYDGAVQGLRQLKDEGYLLIVVSNQSGVAHGYFKEEALQKVAQRIEEELEKANVTLDGFFYCPHHPHGAVKDYAISCSCRKPQPGMILRAAQQFDIDLSQSWMIGDILNDIEAGNKAGCSTILIDNGNETEWILTPERMPSKVVRNISEAVAMILEKHLV